MIERFPVTPGEWPCLVNKDIQPSWRCSLSPYRREAPKNFASLVLEKEKILIFKLKIHCLKSFQNEMLLYCFFYNKTIYYNLILFFKLLYRFKIEFCRRLSLTCTKIKCQIMKIWCLLQRGLFPVGDTKSSVQHLYTVIYEVIEHNLWVIISIRCATKLIKYSGGYRSPAYRWKVLWKSRYSKYN